MEVKKMAETTIKRGRGRPKKEKLFRNITLAIFYQPPNYFRPVQVAQFNVAEKTGDFEMSMVNTDPSVSRPSMSGLTAFLNSGLPRYNSTDEKTGAIRDIYRENSFDDWVANLEGGEFTINQQSYKIQNIDIDYETE